MRASLSARIEALEQRATRRQEQAARHLDGLYIDENGWTWLMLDGDAAEAVLAYHAERGGGHDPEPEPAY